MTQICETYEDFFRYMKGSSTFINTSLNKYEDVEKKVEDLLEELQQDVSYIYIVDYMKGDAFKRWDITIYSLEGIITYNVDALIGSDENYKLSFRKCNHPLLRECLFHFDLSDKFLKAFISEDEYLSIKSYESCENERQRERRIPPLKLLNPSAPNMLDVIHTLHNEHNYCYEEKISSLYQISRILSKNTHLSEDDSLFKPLNDIIKSYTDSSYEDVTLFAQCLMANLTKSS